MTEAADGPERVDAFKLKLDGRVTYVLVTKFFPGSLGEGRQGYLFMDPAARPLAYGRFKEDDGVFSWVP